MKLYDVFVKAPHIDKPFRVFAENVEDAANIIEDETGENVDYPVAELHFPSNQKYVVAYTRVQTALGDAYPKSRITKDMITP